MLSEVTPGLQQLNREAHPRDIQARLRRERRPRNCPEARYEPMIGRIRFDDSAC